MKMKLVQPLFIGLILSQAAMVGVTVVVGVIYHWVTGELPPAKISYWYAWG